MATNGLKVHAEVGDLMNGEVKAVLGGGVRVELDTCEFAYIPVGQLAGRNRDDKSTRHACLRIGQEIEVEVVSVDRSTRNPNIQAREVYDASAKTSTPRRTGRVLTARAS